MLLSYYNIYILWLYAVLSCNISSYHALNEKTTSSDQNQSLIEDHHLSPTSISHSKACHLVHQLHQQNKDSSHCQVILAHHHEPDDAVEWIAILSTHHPTIILNSGEPMHDNNHDDKYCEHRVWSNAGREAYKYLSFILDNYQHPHRFADVNIFCQAVPRHVQYDEMKFVKDVDTLCDNSTSSLPKDFAFAYLASMDMPFTYGYESNRHHPVLMKSLVAYQQLFGVSLTLDQLSSIKFSPGGCFSVTKQQIYSMTQEYYYHIVSYEMKGDHGDEMMESLNEGKDPMIGYIYERSWPVIMGSKCWRSALNKYDGSCRFIRHS